MSFDESLPVIFMALMGVSMLIYVVSDGYDLGVGMLMHRATPAEKDVMIASIGPFWDANETWLVLGVGILLIAFPRAHGLVRTADVVSKVPSAMIGLTLVLYLLLYLALILAYVGVLKYMAEKPESDLAHDAVQVGSAARGAPAAAAGGD